MTFYCIFFISFLEGKSVKWIITFTTGSSFWVFQIMNIDSKKPFPVFPSLFNFVLNPRSICCFFTYQNYNARAIIHIFIYPSFYCRGSFSFYFLPIICRDWLIVFQCANISDLLNSHHIVVEVKAVKDLSFRHDSLLLRKHTTIQMAGL